MSCFCLQSGAKIKYCKQFGWSNVQIRKRNCQFNYISQRKKSLNEQQRLLQNNCLSTETAQVLDQDKIETKQLTLFDAELSKRIRYEKNPRELKRILVEEKDSLDGGCVAAAAVCLAHMLRTEYNQLKKQRRKPSYQFLGQISHLYTQLFELIDQHSENFGDREIGCCLWSLIKVQEHNSILSQQQLKKIDEIFQNLQRKCVKIRIRGEYIAMILWALAKQRVEDTTYAQAIAKKLCYSNLNLDALDAQSTCMIIWAMATLNFARHGDNKTIHKSFQIAISQIDNFSAQEISNLCWSMKNLRFWDYELFDAIGNIITSGKYQYTLQQLLNLMLAYADLKPMLVQFDYNAMRAQIQVLVDEFLIESKTRSYDARLVANFIFAMGIANCDVDLTQKVVDQMVESFEGQYDRFKFWSLAQLWRTKLQYQSQKQVLRLPEELEELCMGAMRRETSQEQRKTNGFAEEVFQQLRVIFPTAQLKPLVFDDMLEVNIGIEVQGGVRVAVQCISLRCFFKNYTGQMVGSTQTYFEMLKGLGWPVVVVRMKEWRHTVGYKRKVIKLINNQITYQQKQNKDKRQDFEIKNNQLNENESEKQLQFAGEVQ